MRFWKLILCCAISVALVACTQKQEADTLRPENAGKLIKFNNPNGVAVRLPLAGSPGFETGYSVDVENEGRTGIVTVTPDRGSPIDGNKALMIPPRVACSITSDGKNYFATACGNE